MNAQDSVASLTRDLACLQPRAVHAKTLELTRGGHRPASMSSGRGSSESPMVEFDREDVRFLGAELAYKRLLGEAAEKVRQALNEQVAILSVRRIKKADDDEDASASDIWCSSCARVNHFEPRADERRAGQENTLCRWCIQFQRIHDMLPPLELLTVRAVKSGKGQRVTEGDLLAAGVKPAEGAKT